MSKFQKDQCQMSKFQQKIKYQNVFYQDSIDENLVIFCHINLASEFSYTDCFN